MRNGQILHADHVYRDQRKEQLFKNMEGLIFSRTGFLLNKKDFKIVRIVLLKVFRDIGPK